MIISIEKNKITTVVSFGEFSKDILINELGHNLNKYHINPNSLNIQSEFNSLFVKLKSINPIKLNEKYSNAKKFVSIPRSDLPYSSRWWMGTSGDRASRSINMKNIVVVGGRVRKYEKSGPNGNYYKLYAPNWATNWSSTKKALTEEEIESIELFKKSQNR